MEISYLRGAYGVIRWKGESNGSVYERCANRVKCGMGGKK